MSKGFAPLTFTAYLNATIHHESIPDSNLLIYNARYLRLDPSGLTHSRPCRLILRTTGAPTAVGATVLPLSVKKPEAVCGPCRLEATCHMFGYSHAPSVRVQRLRARFGLQICFPISVNRSRSREVAISETFLTTSRPARRAVVVPNGLGEGCEVGACAPTSTMGHYTSYSERRDTDQH